MISYEKREMSEAGTLLSDLGSSAPVGDNDLVQRILADLNTTESSSNPVVQPMLMGPPAGNGRVISSPNPNTTYPLAMDPVTATAHMIGKAYPTPADFASMMGGMASGPPGQAPTAPVLAQISQGKGIVADTIQHLRHPLLVAIIFFIISLPVVNVMVGHYLPYMLRAGGDLTTMGLLVKSLAAGALYWALVNVIVPLISS